MTREIPHNDKSLNIQKVKIEKSLPIINDRETFIVDTCSNKNVLHIGCIGTKIERIKEDGSENNEMCLHEKIAEVSNNILGIDIDDDGINELRNKNPNLELLSANVEDIDPSSIDPNLDLIVLGEVLEHMGNPMKALKALREIAKVNDATILITVPNAFGLRNMIGMIFSHTEMTRLDHYYYYSSVVLNSLIRDAGLVRVKQRYYSLTLRRGKFKTFLKRTLFNKIIYRFRPGLSEGLVFFLKVKNT